MQDKFKYSVLAGVLALAAIAIVAPSTSVYLQQQADAAVVLASQPIQADGRCTLQTATPVMSTTSTSASVTYYTPYRGNRISLYNGSNLVMYEFDELSNVTTASVVGNAGPAAVVSGSNYDLFVWNNAGTLALTRGPAWTSDTARNLGLSQVKGVWLNGAAITNGPAISRGTYVCTERSASDSTINWKLGSAASGGGFASLGVWNAQNRVLVNTVVQDATSSWTTTSAWYRAVNGSNNNRASFVVGQVFEGVTAQYQTQVKNGTSTIAGIAIGLDSITTRASAANTSYPTQTTQVFGPAVSTYAGYPGLGFHYFQALEGILSGASAGTFSGNEGSAQLQSGLSVQIWM
jgi:hypothetical protein